MSIIIPSKRVFGHKHIFTGYGSSQPYLYNKTGQPFIDGINGGHISLYKKCDICGEEVLVAKLHVDADGKLYKTKLDK